MVAALVWLAAILLLILAWHRTRRMRRRGIGAAAAGSIYDFLNEEKRNAIEIVIEERAGARDPEDRDGNLPDLEKPRP
jgi:hypothetical protein